MAIIVTVNGSKGPEGFLVAPSGTHEFPVAVGLKTDNGTTVQATLVITAAAGVNVQLSQTSVTIGPTQKSVKIVAKSPSKKRGGGGEKRGLSRSITTRISTPPGSAACSTRSRAAWP